MLTFTISVPAGTRIVMRTPLFWALRSLRRGVVPSRVTASFGFAAVPVVALAAVMSAPAPAAVVPPPAGGVPPPAGGVPPPAGGVPPPAGGVPPPAGGVTAAGRA